ncbi:MAG: DUF3793 family protein [Lachnospiraceae bacterium]|nr:DUF3793 family protein [Lachnospiraceae bacterium]
MGNGTLENKIIEHCAPTLAGMKSAGLFSYFFADALDAKKQLQQINGLLNEKGVYVEALLWRKDSVLVYTYRPQILGQELEKEGAWELLKACGYKSTQVESCLEHLKTRLDGYTCFPHEIGLFLGYPLEDVKGFIENGGRNCKCCGLWKVYCNEKETTKLFARLNKCTDVYRHVFAAGRGIVQMTVCAC